MQHLTTLLAAPEEGVVTATLQAFVALVRKTHIASIRYPGGPEQNGRLLALAQGWGGKEQVFLASLLAVLDQTSCISYLKFLYDKVLATLLSICCRVWDLLSVLMMMSQLSMR